MIQIVICPRCQQFANQQNSCNESVPFGDFKGETGYKNNNYRINARIPERLLLGFLLPLNPDH